MAKKKRDTSKIEPLNTKRATDAWGMINVMLPFPAQQFPSNNPVTLELRTAVGVHAGGLANQIDVSLVSYDSNTIPVASSQTAVYLQPGVSADAAIRLFHFKPLPGTYKLVGTIISGSNLLARRESEYRVV